MYRHDYILRIIERFGQALRALRDRILRSTPASAVSAGEIQEIASEAGLDLAVARSLDPSMLLMWLAPMGDPDPARLWLMGELLYLEGLRGRLEGLPAWRGDHERALAIFENVPAAWRPGDGFAAADERAREIRRYLNEQEH